MIGNMPVSLFFAKMFNEKGDKLSAPMPSSGLKFKIKFKYLAKHIQKKNRLAHVRIWWKPPAK